MPYSTPEVPTNDPPFPRSTSRYLKDPSGSPSYTELAVRLVNSGVPTDTGRDALASVAAYRGLVADRPHLCGGVTASDLEALRLLRAELRLVFEAASPAGKRRSADRLNALLSRYPVHPHIVRHDGQPWHIHLVKAARPPTGTQPEPSPGSPGWSPRRVTGRLGVCAGPGCQRVYRPPGSVRPRRYCSEACASKANVRALAPAGEAAGSTRHQPPPADHQIRRPPGRLPGAAAVPAPGRSRLTRIGRIGDSAGKR